MPPVHNSLIGYHLTASFIAGAIYKTIIAISRLYRVWKTGLPVRSAVLKPIILHSQ
ncbi:unnamed protein product [Penicillium camemberti]|uniref:Str. FM013 n=1 Tax=Penicillium camemberti (strain FM 013) TaxID=1429867 RepID=A0A0G4PRN3_PENC3|nr:unnamed protein product [Penicillium camemberti]